MASTWIHRSGPASADAGRSVTHCPIIPGASNPDRGGSTCHPKTAA